MSVAAMSLTEMFARLQKQPADYNDLAADDPSREDVYRRHQARLAEFVARLSAADAAVGVLEIGPSLWAN